MGIGSSQTQYPIPFTFEAAQLIDLDLETINRGKEEEGSMFEAVSEGSVKGEKRWLCS